MSKSRGVSRMEKAVVVVDKVMYIADLPVRRSLFEDLKRTNPTELVRCVKQSPYYHYAQYFEISKIELLWKREEKEN